MEWGPYLAPVTTQNFPWITSWNSLHTFLLAQVLFRIIVRPDRVCLLTHSENSDSGTNHGENCNLWHVNFSKLFIAVVIPVQFSIQRFI